MGAQCRAAHRRDENAGLSNSPRNGASRNSALRSSVSRCVRQRALDIFTTLLQTKATFDTVLSPCFPCGCHKLLVPGILGQQVLWNFSRIRCGPYWDSGIDSITYDFQQQPLLVAELQSRDQYLKRCCSTWLGRHEPKQRHPQSHNSRPSRHYHQADMQPRLQSALPLNARALV